MKHLPWALAGLLAAGLVTTPAVPGLGGFSYLAATTAVVKNAGQDPILDDGGVVCAPSGAPSLGGDCLPFGGYDSVRVSDAALGGAVAFQVCIDNDGDSLCALRPGERCGDDISFSHDDRGRFFNPLGPLPKGFRPGCPGGPWKGYVVFLCTGVHNAGGSHAHGAGAGSITGVTGGSGFGDFCSLGSGGVNLPAAPDPGKRYVLL